MQQETEQEWEDDPRKMVRRKQNFDTYKEAIISVGYLQVETFPNPIFLRLNSGISGGSKVRKETRSGCVRGSHFWQPLKNYQFHTFCTQTEPTYSIPPAPPPRSSLLSEGSHGELTFGASGVHPAGDAVLSSKTGPWVTECVWRCVCARVCACSHNADRLRRYITDRLARRLPMLAVCWVLAPASLLQNKWVCRVNW